MALPTAGQIIANATADLNAAYRALGDAGDWLRSDWHPDAGPTREQARRMERMRAAIREAKAAINEGKS